MRIAKRLLMSIGTAALVAFLAIVVAPKTAHALVAALVQVTTTTANPVPTEDIRGSASQILELACPTNDGGQGFCVQDDPSTPSSSPFTVPAGQNFVITQIESLCSGWGNGGLSLGYSISKVGDVISDTSRVYEFPCNATTVEFNLQPGLVLGSTGNPIIFVVGKATDAPTYVRGYLTAN
jgi:hypothetical protein